MWNDNCASKLLQVGGQFKCLTSGFCRVWKDNNNTKKFAPKTAEMYRSAFILRQRMMSAIQNIGLFNVDILSLAIARLDGRSVILY